MSLSDYPSWELKPRKLSRQERENPQQVISDFFHYAHLPQVREMFGNLVKTTVTGSYNDALTSDERTSLFYFMEQLEKLIEAAHLIHQKDK